MARGNVVAPGEKTPAVLAHAVAYARERRCPSGGYCFFRLDEPNAADTCFALHVLSLAGETGEDPLTIRFLQGLQAPDGSYPSLAAALYAGGALGLLGARPRRDPSAYILRSLPVPDPRTRVVESLSLFEPLHAWASLVAMHGISLPREVRERVASAVLSFQSEDGGFGFPAATLPDTRMAVEILAAVGEGGAVPDVAGFLASCADGSFGFLPRPGSRPAYLEHVHAGIRLSLLLGERPRWGEACRDFVLRCAHPRGGFARSVFGGIPTLEATARAAESLAILDALSRGRWDYAGLAPYM